MRSNQDSREQPYITGTNHHEYHEVLTRNLSEDGNWTYLVGQWRRFHLRTSSKTFKLQKFHKNRNHLGPAGDPVMSNQMSLFNTDLVSTANCEGIFQKLVHTPEAKFKLFIIQDILRQRKRKSSGSCFQNC